MEASASVNDVIGPVHIRSDQDFIDSVLIHSPIGKNLVLDMLFITSAALG